MGIPSKWYDLLEKDPDFFDLTTLVQAYAAAVVKFGTAHQTTTTLFRALKDFEIECEDAGLSIMDGKKALKKDSI